VNGARDQLIELYQAAVAGANVESLTANAVASVPLERRRRVWVFSFGKAAETMAHAAVSMLERALAEIAGGVVVGVADVEAPSGTILTLAGDHPIPGRRSAAAASRIAQVLSQKRGGDLGIVLISGGASSLIGAPLRGLSEADFGQLSEQLLASGIGIQQMNAVRKRFSMWAAGRLALALAPARTFCFAVSDVPGDDLGTIGSGPCVPDPTKVQQVIEILENAHLFNKIAPSLRQYLFDSVRGAIPETPKATHPAFAHVTARVIANNKAALAAAAAAARRQGHAAKMIEDPLLGDASAAGARVAEALMSARERGERGATQTIIWGGETTVALRGPAPPGGRCQELALAAAKHLADAGERAKGITVLAAGTDGRDGPTDAAGAVVDATTWNAIAATGRDPMASLRAHESYDALNATGALVKGGPTGTNVMDVTIGLVERQYV
jgi:glycerate 2-kinase